MTHDSNPLVERLFKLNAARAYAYFKGRHKRERYFRKNPIHWIIIQCMDGRHNEVDRALGILPGCSDPYKTGGGNLDLGGNLAMSQITNTIDYGISQGRDVVILVSSHYSGRHPNHGCRAFSNDRCAAHMHAVQLTTRLRNAVQLYTPEVHVLTIEYDTDNDAVRIYGKDVIFDSADFLADEKGLEEDLAMCLPTLIGTRVYSSLLSSMRYNVRHVRSVLRRKRHLIDVEHGETTLVLGRGIWLTRRNDAIVVFPEGDDLDKNIVTGLGILHGNMERNRMLRKYGPVILCSAAYRDNRRLYFAMEQADGYARRMQRLLATFQGMRHTLMVGTFNREAQVFTPHHRVNNY